MKNSDRIFRTLGAMVVLAALAPLGAAGVQSQPMTKDEVANKLVGAWRYVGTTIDGVNKPRGNNPSGMIYYGPQGERAVQTARDGERNRAGAEMTPDEAKAALPDYIPFFGPYTIDEKAGPVTHHRQS